MLPGIRRFGGRGGRRGGVRPGLSRTRSEATAAQSQGRSLTTRFEPPQSGPSPHGLRQHVRSPRAATAESSVPDLQAARERRYTDGGMRICLVATDLSRSPSRLPKDTERSAY